MKLKTISLLAVAIFATTALPSAAAQTNQVPALQRQLGLISQSTSGTAAINAILAAYRRTATLNPNQAPQLLRIANARLNRFVRPQQRQVVAAGLARFTSAAFVTGRIPASSPLYLQTFPFIATTVPVAQRTPAFLNRIVDIAAFGNAAAGGDPELEVPVTDAILGDVGNVPPPVS
jgi:hypothetical protein